ncbi:MAG: RNA ligase partner protein [Patescibacteria group bacterium]|nr:RNA ligase partner protein [Patescibacteria group bacterium]
MSHAYILDTNLFFNMEAGLGMGRKSEEVIRTMTDAIRKQKPKGITFYMPPRIVEEFLSFFEDTKQPFLQEFLAEVIIKSPSLHEITLGANIFYKLINEIRNRSYRGMDIGEEEIKKGAQLFVGKEHMDRKGFEMTVGPVIKTFRERYRTATRVGFLDSVADLDLIMLAKETGGTVVSADEGVLKWGRIFGVTEMPAAVFGQLMLR